MKVIIAGSRSFQDYETLKTYCTHILSHAVQRGEEVTVLSGTARGADELGELFANDMGFTVERYPADWEAYGKMAGFKRNKEMAENADALIAFWDGKSRGTKHMINLAKHRWLDYRVYEFNKG